MGCGGKRFGERKKWQNGGKRRDLAKKRYGENGGNVAHRMRPSTIDIDHGHGIGIFIMASTSPLCFITLFRVEDIHSLCIWVGVLLFWFWHSSDVIRHAICDILFVFVVIIQSCTCTLTLNYNHLQYFYLIWGWQCRSHPLQLR